MSTSLKDHLNEAKQNCPEEKEQIFPLFYLVEFISPSLSVMSTRTKRLFVNLIRNRYKMKMKMGHGA